MAQPDYDIFPPFALALEPSAPDVMKRARRDPGVAADFPFRRSDRLARAVAHHGSLSVAFAVGMHWHGIEGEGLRQSTTMAFMTLAMAQVFHAFMLVRNAVRRFQIGLFTNAGSGPAIGICLILQVAAVYLPILQEPPYRTPKLADWARDRSLFADAVAVVEVVEVIQRVATLNKESPIG